MCTDRAVSRDRAMYEVSACVRAGHDVRTGHHVRTGPDESIGQYIKGTSLYKGRVGVWEEGRADLGCKNGVGHVAGCFLKVRQLQQLCAGGPPRRLRLNTCLHQNRQYDAMLMLY